LPSILWTRGVHFRLCSVFIKKSNQTEFFLKKTETEPKPVQTYRFRFGFLEQKPVQTGLAWFFWFGSVFFWFGSVFFRFFLVRVQFVFFKILIALISFFHGSVFSVIFFRFSRFNWFFGFFEHPYYGNLNLFWTST